MWQTKGVSETDFEGSDLSENPDSLTLGEEEVRPWGPWWSLFWAFVVICVWQLSQLVVVSFLSFRQSGAEGVSQDGLAAFMETVLQDGDVVGLMSFVTAVIACVMILAIVKVRGTTLAQGLALRAPRKWWMWLLVFPTWFVGMLVIGFLVSPFQGDQAAADQANIATMVEGTHYLVLLLLGVSVGAPLFEEFLFRGLLHEGLRQSVIGPIGSGILTAAFFSLMHSQYQDPAAFLVLFLLGGLFTLVREVSGSLWISVAMHAIQNTMVTGMMFLAVHDYVPADKLPEDLRQIFESEEQPAAVAE